jgi:hypothetical protein
VFWFYSFWYVYAWATACGAVSWFFGTVVHPFFSAFCTYPLWQVVSPEIIFKEVLGNLNLFSEQQINISRRVSRTFS